MSNIQQIEEQIDKIQNNNMKLFEIFQTVMELPENKNPETLKVTPTKEYQEHRGLYNVVLVDGDADLKPENIKEGTSIFGVEGSAKTADAKITSGAYLFYQGNRIDNAQELLDLCENINSCYFMFNGSRQLQEIDLSKLDTSNVTDMSSMFASCTNLKELDLSNFNTSNVTSMTNMFSGCTMATNINIKNFNTSNITKMTSMFNSCAELQELNLSSFNTSNVTHMDSMFYQCKKLKTLDLTSFDFSNVENMDRMFYQCENLESLKFGNNESFKNEDFEYTFGYCRNLKDLDLSSFDFGNTINVKSIFYACRIENLKGCKNLGKAYTQKTENYSNYKLELNNTYLTHESLMNVINNLYDLNLTYDVANGGTLYRQELKLGSTNKAKLTEEEIAIATNKGWNVT